MSKTYDVIIVGSGIAGLTSAFKLLQRKKNILILEEKNIAGGNVRTISYNDYKLEAGPSSFMGSSDNIWKLIYELGIENNIVEASSNGKSRYIYRDNQLHPLPTSAGAFIKTNLLSWKSKFRLAAEPFIRNGARTNDTAWDFFERRFGTEAATYIMSPFISGIYAGDVRKLGARAAFPKFWNFENQHGSMIKGAVKFMIQKRKRLKSKGIAIKKGLYSFMDGIGVLTSNLTDILQGSIMTGKKVVSLASNDGWYKVITEDEEYLSRAVIIATPPAKTGQILLEIEPELNSLFSSIPMAPVVLIHWTIPEGTIPYPPGFGFLMPKIYDYHVLGTIFTSDLFPERARHGQSLYSSFYAGMHDPEVVNMSDETLISMLINEHSQILNTNLEGKAEILKILRYSKAIPQLLPKHPEIMEKISNQLAGHYGLFLAGNYITGVGVEHAVSSGYIAADRCLDCIDGKSPELLRQKAEAYGE